VKATDQYPATASAVRLLLTTSGALLLALSGATAFASATAADATDAEAGHDWSLRLNGDAGADSARGLSGAIDFAPQGSPLSLGVSALRAESSPPGVVAGATTHATTRSTSWALEAGYDFGLVGAKLGYADARDDDLRSSRAASATLSSALGDWNLGLTLQRRETDFDALSLNTPITLRSGQVVNIGGVARCAVDDLGYGLTLGWQGQAWSAYVSATKYDYQSIACRYSTNAPSELNRLSRRVFTTLVGRNARLFEPRAGGVIGQQSQLLDSVSGAGVARDIGRVTVAVDWLHTRAAFADTTQDGYSMTLAWPNDAAWAIELTGGTTVADSESAPYGGLGLRLLL
jgi:hypothetical protein